MKHGTLAYRNNAYGFLGAAIVIALWKLAAIAMASDIALPPPEKAAAAFLTIMREKKFFASVAATLVRGSAAFFVSLCIGACIGFFTALSRRVNALVRPAITLIQATPVLAVILLALIWFPAGIVPVFSAVIMAFPVMTSGVYAGIRSCDAKLLQMAASFGVPKREVSLRIRLPSALPYAVSAAKSSLGLCWKVVVAGEVLSQPALAVGSGMQNARIMLETASVFAWALVGVTLCALSDAGFSAIVRKIKWNTA